MQFVPFVAARAVCWRPRLAGTRQYIGCHLILYCLKGADEALLPLNVSPDTSGKCIVGVPICSGMGATNLKFWVLSRLLDYPWWP